MKTQILSFLLILIAIGCFAQTATNFTAKDCDGITHDLFSELDAGKVVVLNWVMPCGACVPASLTTSTVVQGYQESNPDAILYYLVDDLANTSCNSLLSWSSGVPLSPVAAFSDASINMLDYGTQAMPKVVVLGGGNHHVFLVADAVVEPTDLQDAINSALVIASIPEEVETGQWARLSKNPANDRVILKIKVENTIHVLAELFNMHGTSLTKIFNGTMAIGDNSIGIDLSQYQAGIYYIRVSDTKRIVCIKLVIKN
jgi:hypothetical protein